MQARWASSVVAALLLCAPLHATAQRATITYVDPSFAHDTQAIAVDAIEDRTPQMVLGGILGGTIGLAVGAAVGVGIELSSSSSCYEYCGLLGMGLGGVAGETLGMAFGVHTGNNMRGSFLASLLGPVAVVAGTIAVLSSIGDPGIPGAIFVVGIPAAQLVTSIAGEKAAAERRQQ